MFLIRLAIDCPSCRDPIDRVHGGLLSDPAINYKTVCVHLLEALPLPVFIVDHTLTIRSCNQPGLRLSASSYSSLQGMPLDQVIQDPAIIQLVQESIQTESRHKGRYEKNTSDILWKVSVSPLAHSYFAVIIEDLTETRRLERMQRDFLANISHELRTPLTSVRLLAETLKDVIDMDPSRAHEFVEKIETEVHYLSELVEELLELSLLESGQTLMTIEPTKAETLVREAMARMLTLAQRRRVQLSTDIQQESTLVAADSRQITRVLVNLVHNAIKFTPLGGKITIGTALQANDLTQRFFVHDTGVGIRSEELPRIFERFYKTDRARAKVGFIGPGGGGTGLGLAIARHVVEAHGGHIWAESTLGEGSTFTFILPIIKLMEDSEAPKT
jgi:two-component system, OmpR family, phosphate regulon sensor histidine kinase PhoR